MPTRETPTHSPAPFSLDTDGDIVDANGRSVALLYPESGGADDDADRRLILKAPELLAVCRAFVRMCEAANIPLDLRHPAWRMKALVDHIDGGGE